MSRSRRRPGKSVNSTGLRATDVDGPATRRFARRLTEAVAWARGTGWPGGRADVRVATRLYHDRSQLNPEGEQWRSSFYRALDLAMRTRHGDGTADHRVVLCATLIEDLHRRRHDSSADT